MISSCSAEETDQHSIQHVTQCIRSRFSKVAVCAVDKDVIMLLLAYCLEAQNLTTQSVCLD